jgi:hypothetical protein
MDDATKRALATVMLDAQSRDEGVVPSDPDSAELLVEWERLGWAESEVDKDGDRVYLLTYAGLDAILGPTQRERLN